MKSSGFSSPSLPGSNTARLIGFICSAVVFFFSTFRHELLFTHFSATGASLDTYRSHMAPLGKSSTINTGNRHGADGREGAPVLTAESSLPSHGNKSCHVGRNILGRTRGVWRDAAALCIAVLVSLSHCGEKKGGFYFSFPRLSHREGNVTMQTKVPEWWLCSNTNVDR